MARWPTREPHRVEGRRAFRRAARLLGIAVVVVMGWQSAPVHGDEPRTLRFARHGESVAALELSELRQVADARTVRVFEPYEEREIGFRALRFERVLDAVYSDSWRSEEELLFTCQDGYQPSVPVQRFLEHDAWLAFEREDDYGFAIDKFESGRRQRISLGPYYLVWENLGHTLLRQEGDYGWPYQVIGVDLIRARDRFPRMAPAQSASPEIQRGFAAFRVHCSRCHPLNGEGGSIGPELNAPSAPVGRRDPAWLRRWIDDPSQIAATSRMPALNPALPDRDRTLDGIVAYLQAMAQRNGGSAEAPLGER